MRPPHRAVTARPSFDERVAPHLPKLYRLAYRLTGNVADAEDLLQDVVVKLYERRAELAGFQALLPWAARALHNLFVDRVRYYARRRLTSIGSAESERAAVEAALGQGSAADDVVATGFDIKAVAAAVAKLALEHRTVLLMHDAEGYRLHEIQEVTGVPLGTLKSRLHRARQRLRELLEAGGTF